MEIYEQAVRLIRGSSSITAFTGSGISVESGIPTFRGENGIWSRYNPELFDINFFRANPKKSWELIKELFLRFENRIEPNKAHIVLAEMEKKGVINGVITQNIDNLHQQAGNRVVHEFHGNSQRAVCLECGEYYIMEEIDFKNIPPVCNSCKGILKPDFVFFGEPISQEAYQASLDLANSSDLFIVIGTTGEVMPACTIPVIAKQNGAKIIEVNTEKSQFSDSITDIFLKGKASEVMDKISVKLFS